MAEAVKEKKKLSKGKKALVVILGIIVFIALASVIFINITTMPKRDTEKNLIPVGGMVYSDTIEYKCDSSKGIRHNPVIRIMQMVWRFCANGDAKVHSTQTPPKNIEKKKSIPYIDDGNMYHKLDVFYPKGTEKQKLPVIIDIHGGGWMYGDKDLNEYYCLELASKGYCVFSVSYRLVPDVTVNEQLQDVAEALLWIRSNMPAYPGDLGKVMLTGDSAGGQIAAYEAAFLTSPELRDTFRVVDAGLKVHALVLTSPVAYMKDGGAFSVYTKIQWGKDYKKKETYEYMDLDKILEYTSLPPTYLITSDGDALAHDQTHRASELLAQKGIKYEIVNFGNDENGKALPHVFSILDPFGKSGQEAIDGSLEFFKSVTTK
ncbi:MAG: alpha/beta hydrolase [Eubacterium sp.]|nr:alpha/beta hydrolase [Eubacterium sp.]